VIVLASEAPERVSRLLAGVRVHAPDATQVVVVSNDPSEPQARRRSPPGHRIELP